MNFWWVLFLSWLALGILAQAFDTAGKLWTLPVTLLGLAIGYSGRTIAAFGQLNVTVSRQHNAICFENFPWGRPDSAMTLGNCIIATCALSFLIPLYAGKDSGHDSGVRIAIGDHEEAHTYQFQRRGVFFLLQWLLAGGPHSSDGLERQADRYALNKEGK